MKIKELFETATAGATSAGNIATVANPHISPVRLVAKKATQEVPEKVVLNHLHSLSLKSKNPPIMHWI